MFKLFDPFSAGQKTISLRDSVANELTTIVESAKPYSFRDNPRYGKENSLWVYMWLIAPRWPVPDDQTDFSPEECDAIASFKQIYGQFVARTLPDMRIEKSYEIQQWQIVQAKAQSTLELLCRSSSADTK